MGDDAKQLDELLDFDLPSDRELFGNEVPPYDVVPGGRVKFVGTMAEAKMFGILNLEYEMRLSTSESWTCKTASLLSGTIEDGFASRTATMHPRSVSY